MDINLKQYLKIDQARFDDIYARYRLLHDQPDACRPMINVMVPAPGMPTWEERLADPMVMLRAELDAVRSHLQIGDDRVPTVRVQFGTAQVAAAFGCSMFVPENNLPAAGDHVLTTLDDVDRLPMPPLNAGWYGKLAEWTALWKDQLPEGVHIQHPDIQSAFNSAHLIRGNDILTDFYDAPDKVGRLLDRVTDFMVAITKHTKAMISDDPEWFFDWGALWKGSARISNCSMHMISPKFYQQHVFPRDLRFFDSVGGGRMHYCGTADSIIDEFFKVPSIAGLDVDHTHHDFYTLCERAPKRVVIIPTLPFTRDSQELKRMLRGDWPQKRNIIISVEASSVEDGREILQQLRRSLPYN
jgi:hypothetical protein